MEVLSTLTPPEEKVLKLRFGIEDGRTRTLEEVGKEFNVTRERIRQIEAKALRKPPPPPRRGGTLKETAGKTERGNPGTTDVRGGGGGLLGGGWRGGGGAFFSVPLSASASVLGPLGGSEGGAQIDDVGGCDQHGPQNLLLFRGI